MAKKLIIDPKFLERNPVAFTVIRGKPPKRVSLHGECVIDVPESIGGPTKKVTVPAPTQADLAVLHGLGVGYVIEVSDGPESGKFATDKNIAPAT
jgi:hypothetical protein